MTLFSRKRPDKSKKTISRDTDTTGTTVQSNRRLYSWSRWVSLGFGIALLAAAFFVGRYIGMRNNAPQVRVPVLFQPTGQLKQSTTLHQETVLTIGGSMAYGWRDPSNDSYLQRAFAGLSASTNVNYTYYNHAIVGASVANFIKNHHADYQSWLQKLHPNVVVISFGLLNDIAEKTPIDTFDADFKKEISMALAQHAVVLIVTPPVVLANYTYAAGDTSTLIAQEKQVANSFHSTNVKFFNLYNQMMAYLAAHRQTYKPYEGDSWHPNRKGHILAGSMLQNDIVTVLGQGPILYK